MPHLHWTLVDKEAIKLDGRVIGHARLGEDDGGNPTTHAVGAIGDRGFLDRANRFAKVFLN